MFSLIEMFTLKVYELGIHLYTYKPFLISKVLSVKIDLLFFWFKQNDTFDKIYVCKTMIINTHIEFELSLISFYLNILEYLLR